MPSLATKRRAFTLIELLVVIAIIAILIGLLIPAVQKVRETMQRTSCQNNLKQIGLGMQSYHGAHECFPPGATGTWTFGWAALVLPYIEQANAYDLLNPAQTTYIPSPGTLPNRDFFNNLIVPVFVCPSSPLPPTAVPEDNTTNVQILVGNYVGIMGASTSGTNFADPTGQRRVADWATSLTANQCNFGGYAASNGVLYPGSRVRLTDISDGSSSTLIVGEQSDWGRNPGVGACAANNQLDIRMPKRAGLWTGASTNRPPMEGQGASESASIVTVRWPIGQKTRVSHNDGIARYGWNTPIQSIHQGGANVVRCDGSVTFLTNTIPFTTLSWLCIRDDGKVTGEY